MKLAEFQVYDNAARWHASSDGHTPPSFATGRTVAAGDLRHQLHWVSHYKDLVTLPGRTQAGDSRYDVLP